MSDLTGTRKEPSTFGDSESMASMPIGRKPMSAARGYERCARIGQQIASALAYAHGVLRRDVKPANILLDELGMP